MQGLLSMDWFNFRTGAWVRLVEPRSDEEARQYIPQDSAAQRLYSRRRAEGDGVIAAMVAVLTGVLAEAGERG